jgi:protease-4
VKAKTYASGNLKGMLNPFEPSTPEGEAKAQALVDELGRQFEMLLVERRGKKLTQPIANYTTGEVWGGQDALGLGLVDSNGTIETLMSQHPDLKLVDFGPFERKSPLGGLWQSVDDIAVSLKESVALLKAAAPR